MRKLWILLLPLFVLEASGAEKARKPASIRPPEFSDIRSDLGKLYPELSKEEMEIRFQATSSAFRFLRAFVPFYYELAKGHDDKLPASVRAAMKEAGWCIGDPHPENFGVLLLPSGAGRFTVNDLDDSGPCPLVLDALRFFTAAKFASPEIDLGKVREHYLNGLEGREEKLSSYTEKLVRKAELNGTEPSDKYVTSDGKLAPVEGYEPATKKDLAEITALFLARNGAKVLDASSTMRLKGGSGGLQRFFVLLEDKRDGLKFPRLMELKEIGRPGIFPAASGRIPGDATRFDKSLSLTQGRSVLPSYGVLKIGGKNYFSRPKWHGTGADLDDVSGRSLETLIRDEAGILGAIHRRSAEYPDRYLKAIRLVEQSDWEKAASLVSGWFQNAFRALKNGR